ncbi:MAG: glycosyl hydrolase family 28-related protein [Acidobacteriaceae bacterium]
MTIDCTGGERRTAKRISTFLRIFLVHAISFSACVYAQTAFSPNETQTAVPHTGSPWINVVSYGAKADGVADDTAAINNAMTACTTRAVPNNGCVLYFPAGIYITTGLTLRSYVSMKGDGWGTSVIQLKPHTASDVLTVPVDTFNFSIYGLTLDGNSARGGTGNCFSVAPTSTGPAEWNTANKRRSPVNAQKWGHVEEVMFSHCSVDGIHINAFNYMLFFDNFYSFDNGVYGLYTEGTNSGFSNFEIERNGTAGIHVDGANDRFTSGEVIWNGSTVNSEAGMYVSGFRNIITAVETEDNYTSGFSDRGNDNEFIGCVSDSNGYVQGNTSASSRSASGFILKDTGGVYVGDKVTSYRGRLPDGNFTTEWPYTIENPHQATIDISYDSTNRPAPTIASPLLGIRSSTLGRATCIKSPGPPVVIGFCSTKVSSSGSCTCN